jgi:hypothetical protein
MKSQILVESYPAKPQKPNTIGLDGHPFLSQDTSILIVFIIFSLGWILNRIIASGYAGSFNFKNESGMKIAAKLTPPEKTNDVS